MRSRRLKTPPSPSLHPTVSVADPPLPPLTVLRTHPAVAALASALASRRRVVATGAGGSSTHLLAAALALHTARPVVLIVAHLDDADEALDEISALGVPALRLPALETLPGESNVNLDLLAERLAVQQAAAALDPAQPAVCIAPIQALMQAAPAPASLPQLTRTLRRGTLAPLAELLAWLAAAGYTRVEAVEEPGDFALRGGILDIFPTAAPPSINAAASGTAAAPGVPVRLDFFGDEIDRMSEIDPDTMGSDRAVDSVHLTVADPSLIDTHVRSDSGTISPVDIFPATALALLAETGEIVEQARGYYERVSDSRGIFGPPAVLKTVQARFHALAEINAFSAGAAAADTRIDVPVRTLPSFDRDARRAMDELRALSARGRALVFCQNAGERQRLGELLAEPSDAAPDAAATATSLHALDRYLHRGFVWDDPAGPIAFVPYHELLNRFTIRRRTGATPLRTGRALDTFLDFAPGDFVVHADHGIARFAGLTLHKPRAVPRAQKIQHVGPQTTREPEPEEFLTLEFANHAKLHVPAAQIDLVQKYIGGFSGKPPLSTLGGQRWQNQKDRVAQSVKDLAGEMLRVRAARNAMPGVQYPADTAWQSEFEAEFPYTETEDQLTALTAIKKDMAAPKPMDRLICGDVGFGKTELAIRAAFKACEYGKQVAVLVPTTVLAEQHERTFRARFSGYPFRIESLSRFKSDADAREILHALARGHVDVVIGTHRLLSKDVDFNDLGLVIVDEEQRFGVEHKEALLRLRLTVDVLTLSATPIPRTLHMAMLGLRDISSLTTPPLDRRAIVTEVIPYNERRVKQAIERELAREGQVYFVHNRVHDIRSVADDVQRLVPGARIVVGHGQMPPHELEDVMLRFLRGPGKDGGADILVSTTIIESGIDIASANTMIINDADRFGLSELHQLRGRVGRSKNRAYCYLLLPADRTVKDVAQKRLKAIEQYSMLGAGFKIAMRDLEIRGAGNILGPEQSGHIAAVGYDMYCQLLEQAVRDLSHERPPQRSSNTSIEIGLSASIPRVYIPSDQRRLEAYRRLATAASLEQLAQVKSDLTAAYGEPPKALHRLLHLAELRLALARFNVSAVTIRERDVVFRTTSAKPLADRLAQTPPGASKAIEATVTVLPAANSDDLAEVYFRPPEKYLEPETLLSVLRKRLS